MERNTAFKEIAYEDNTIALEDLPFQIVLYPRFAFFGFARKPNAPIFLCSCSREAVENYIRFRTSKQIPLNADPARMFVLDSMYFPRALVEILMKQGRPNDYKIIEFLNFENKLCHECNGIVPKYRYCHEMYGGAFKQNYGWYINKQAYEFGIEPITNRIIPELCPNEVLELVKIDPNYYYELVRTNPAEAEKLRKKFQRQNNQIWNVIENEVRLKFGHKKIGEAWISETILYYIIRNLYPNMTILRHFRPDFLEGLELDIFIKELNVGVEYQGIQHFKAVKHWGGKKALKKLQARDEKKKQICKSLGIHLIYFNYDEGLSKDLVLVKLKKHIEGL